MVVAYLSKAKHVNSLDVLGESVRRKIDDGEAGVPLHMDMQIIDVNTCEPAKGVYLEIWSKLIASSWEVTDYWVPN
jgi:protocatechuate 3,4-dioxygenase beta subunit